MPARNHVIVVARTMAVLEALSRFEGAADLKTIAAKTGIGKSTVFRILFTLKELGYVEQHLAGGAYSTTAKVFALARSPAKRPKLTTIAHPHLVRLRDLVTESVWLAEWRRGVAVLVDVVESGQPLRLSYDLGDRCPIHASALGKVIAAQLPTEQLEPMLTAEPLPRFTRYTITEPEELRKHLSRVRQRGYALNSQETVEGAIMIAAPLFAGPGQVAGAISVSAPVARCPLAKREEIIREIRRVAGGISDLLPGLGYRPPSPAGPTPVYRPSALETAP